MVGKRRLAKDIAVPSRDKLDGVINSLESLRDRALVSFIYLTGCRVSEALGVKKKQVVLEEINGQAYMVIYGVSVLKQKKGKVKTREIVINLRLEGAITQYILRHMDKLEDEELLFAISRKRVWAIFNRKLKIFPHLLRHWRCTHLVQEPYNFNAHQITNFIGWAGMDMSMHYISAGSKIDMAKQMRYEE